MALLAASLLGVPAGTAPAAAAPAAGAQPAGVRITLVTGDTVAYRVGPDGRAAVEVVDAVSHSFRGTDGPDGTYLYPIDAEPLLEAGAVDRELFNVKYLAENGYDDAHSTSLPLIVDYTGTGATAATRARNATRSLAGSKPGRVLESIGAAGVAIDKAAAADFWRSLAPQRATGKVPATTLAAGVQKVWLDRRVTVTLDESVPQIGAPQAWEAGYDGTGVTVAVLDTGVDATHPDLAGRIVAARNFTSDPSAVDEHGHGTHVAATVAGSGAASSGRYKGVAPGARLLVGKVLNRAGSGLLTWIVDGMEWAATEADADIVSMSLGTAVPSDGSDPMSQAVNQLTATTDTLFVIAAGNAGPQSIGSPGAAARALTVGAVDKQDKLAGFSGTGPLVDIYHVKPEITAPGVQIAAARAAGTSMGTPLDEHYTAANGTSMATPHVAGAAAILLQRHPEFTADEVKATLVGTATDGGFTAWQQGAGRVDVARAARQQLRVDTASISPGVLDPASQPSITRLTYHNAGSADLAVSVVDQVRGPGGEPVPDDLVTVTPATVTVSAGGTASVTVTVNHTASVVGLFDGAIVATTGAGDQVRVPIGFRGLPFTKELTVRLVKPADVSDLSYFFQGFHWWAIRVDDQKLPWYVPLAWRTTDDPQVLETSTRVPEGLYTITGDPNWQRYSGKQTRDQAQLVEPEVTVAGDTTVTIDMRKLVPVSVTADRPTEEVWRTFMSSRKTASGAESHSWTLVGLPEGYQSYRYPTRPVTVGSYRVREGFILAEPEVQLHLKAGGRTLTVQPSYPDYPANLEDKYVKFDRDQQLRMAIEADVTSGRNVRGQLVHVDLPTDPQSSESWESCPDGGAERSWICAVVTRVHTAAQAGAAGVVLSTPKASLQTLGHMNHPRYTPMLQIPLMWLDDAQTRRMTELLGGDDAVRVHVDAALNPTYEYKLWQVEDGKVPASMAYTVHSRNLKRIDTRYHADTPAVPDMSNAYEAMHSYWPGEILSFATVRYFDAPTERAEYYSVPGKDVLSFQMVNLLDPVGGTNREGVVTRTVADTRRESLTWGSSLTVPGQPRVGPLPGGLALVSCVVCRQGDTLRFRNALTEGEGSQAYNIGAAAGVTAAVRLYRDGKEVPAQSAGAFPLPPGSGHYRLDHTVTDTSGNHRYAKKVHTVWDFTATARPQENEVLPPYAPPNRNDEAPSAWQPTIFLNYEAPLGLDNTAEAGRPLWMTLHAASPRPGSGADIAGLDLRASYDGGKTWVNPRHVRHLGDGTYRMLLVPPQHSTGAVTLRTRAWDNAGNEVTQTIENAFGLR